MASTSTTLQGLLLLLHLREHVPKPHYLISISESRIDWETASRMLKHAHLATRDFALNQVPFLRAPATTQYEPLLRSLPDGAELTALGDPASLRDLLAQCWGQRVHRCSIVCANWSVGLGGKSPAEDGMAGCCHNVCAAGMVIYCCVYPSSSDRFARMNPSGQCG